MIGLVYNVFDYNNCFKGIFVKFFMDLFMPSNKILEKICEKDELLCSYDIYPRGDGRFNEEMTKQFITKLSPVISDFYKINFVQEERSELSVQKIFYVAGESLKNCYDHGPKDKAILFGLFLGNRGVCYGFQDGGDYFKSEKIKYQYENKVEITEFDQNILEENSQDGVNLDIFPNSDLIEVDSFKGILYCVQLKENIIAPEGEDGNSYFSEMDRKS